MPPFFIHFSQEFQFFANNASIKIVRTNSNIYSHIFIIIGINPALNTIFMELLDKYHFSTPNKHR
jgi:hypothetical protein